MTMVTREQSPGSEQSQLCIQLSALHIDNVLYQSLSVLFLSEFYFAQIHLYSKQGIKLALFMVALSP